MQFYSNSSAGRIVPPEIIVNPGLVIDTDSINSVIASTIYDTFDGSGGIDSNLWDTLNASDISVTQSGGRYVGDVAAGSGNDSLWFHASEGRLDYVTITGDFDFISRGHQILTGNDAGDVQFSGVIVRLSSGNWEFIVAGNRTTAATNTIELKSTTSGTSNVDDLGDDVVLSGIYDLRARRVGSAVDFFYQDNAESPDNWTMVDHDGLPGARVSFGTGAVQIGITTYGQNLGPTFTCGIDQVEIPVGVPS